MADSIELDQNATVVRALQSLAIQMAEMNATMLAVQCDVKEVRLKQAEANGTLHKHDVELAVIREWRDNQARPAVKENTERVFDLKMEVTQLAVKGASFVTIAGLTATVVAAILKVFGVF